MLQWLTKLTDPGQDGPGKLIAMADRFGLLSDNLSMLVAGLRRAPEPKLRELGPDWMKNLDVITHSLGCVAAGVFDNMVEGMTEDEVESVTKEEFMSAIGDVPMAGVMGSTFEVCKAVYLQYGDVTGAIDQGLIKPEGMMTHAFISPLLPAEKKQTDGETDNGPVPLLKRIVGKGSEPKSTISLSEDGQDDLVI